MIVMTPGDSSAPRIEPACLSSGRHARTGGASAISVVPSTADHCRDGESENRRDRSGQERHEQRPGDESDLLQRGLERVRSCAQLCVDEHPRPQRPQRRTDRRHQRAGRAGTHRDHRERRVEQRERTDREQERREDDRARKQDPRLPAPVDETPRYRRPNCGRHEVGAGDRAGRRIAAAVLADEQQQRQSDHPHRQPRK